MDRNGHKHRPAEPENGHTSEDDLLLYADGELDREQATSIQAHLEACWSCRARSEKYEETIRSFVEYSETILKPMDEAPPSGWRKFDRRLEELVVERGTRSPFARMRGWLASFRPSLPSFSFGPQLAGRLVAVLSILAIVIVILLVRSNHVTVVSASELLQRAVDAQSSVIRATTQPVIHQKLQVRARKQAASTEDSVSWEVWRDVQGGRFHSVVGAQTSDTDVVKNLSSVLRTNQMDPQRPLSPDAYQSWCNSLAQKQEEVTRTKLSGVDALTLRTVSTGAVNDGQIAEAVLTVRAADWHLLEERLNVKAADGTIVYELSEIASEVVSLNQVNQSIFGSEPPAVAKVEAKPSPSSSTKESAEPSTLSPNATATVASGDLEVEVLRLLHQADADMGEQITVKRSAGGPVRVSGIVETDQRKREIVTALSPLAANPSVQIDIQTVTEALANQKQKTSNMPRPSTSEGLEIQSTGIAAEPELRAYFERRGANVDTAVRQFAAGTVSQSAKAMQSLGAMKRLVNQFSPQQLRALTPDARAKWLELLRAHARAYQQQSAALRRELKPVFFAGANEDLPSVSAISSDEELGRVVQELFAAGAVNDQVIRSAFTVTREGARFTAVNTPQFWQAMKKAEALAARISRQ